MFKVATFLNDPPEFAFFSQAPHIVEKLMIFATKALNHCNWNGKSTSSVDSNDSYPLHAVTDISTLSVRVIEYWEYVCGGGLVDRFHYDVDSILTIVVLLSDEFEGNYILYGIH